MPQYEFLDIVRIAGIKAANHTKSMERDVKITVTVDGELWPISKPEWDRSYEYDGNRVTTWEQNGPEEGETKEVKDEDE